ncbi:hypothetical protein [Streptomyces sp. NPDC057257]|uniref:hypothetical protein n=1 Tax=Streptomyces sp. NPDC057257 TaxID=3346071 RepID=UPI003631F80D
MVDRSGDVVWIAAVEPEPRTPSESSGTPESALLKQWTLDQLPLPMSLFDRSGTRVAVNAAMAGTLDRFAPDLFGVDHRGPEPWQFLPDPESVGEAAEHVLRTGET